MKGFFLTILIGISVLLNAQEKLEYIDPDFNYERGIESYQDGNSEYALHLLEAMDENDSVYVAANIARSSILLEEGRYDEAILLCDSFLSRSVMECYSFYINKGVAQLRGEKYQDAVTTFNNALKDYPMSYLLYYNLGNAYENTEDYEQAVHAYQKAILLNPYYANAHYRLGRICYLEKQITQAVLCWDTYLLLQPDSESSLNTLVLLNDAVSQRNENVPHNITLSEDDPVFKEVNLIVNNYAALNKKYKISNKIKLPVVKQNHVIMEKLEEISGHSEGFWCKKYVPFYKELYQSGYFDDFIYRIFTSSTAEEYQKIVQKNEKGQDAFLSWAGDALVKIMGKDNADFWGKEIDDFQYQSNGTLSAVGKADENMVYNGPFVFYNSNGSILSKGYFTNDQRDKNWVWYLEDGSEELRAQYQSGVYQGPYSKYFKNGNLKEEGSYQNDYLHGEIKTYNIFGALIDASLYREGVYEGISTVYYNLGEGFKQYEVNYKEGLLDGKVFEFYPNGHKKMEMNYNAGEPTGEEIYYYDNGNISYQYAYQDGVLNGKHLSLYLNGNTHMEGQYTDGYKSGTWKTYYKSGILSAEEKYGEAGVLSGLYKEYDKDGHMVTSYEYEDGHIKAFAFYDSEGNILAEENEKDQILNYKGFNSYGVLTKQGLFKNGSKEGEWKYYNNYGTLTTEEVYENGSIVGTGKTYYVDGKDESSVDFSEGLKNGYFQNCYVDGTIQSQGYYKNDKAQRIWFSYYPDGTLASRNFLKDDEYEGFQYVYGIEGTLTEKQYLEDNMHFYSVFYDSLGHVTDTLNLLDEDEKVYHYPDGTTYRVMNYVNGYLHGKYQEYHPNKKLSAEGDYFYNNMHGIWKWWDDQGNLIREANYDNGYYDGYSKSYYSNGSPLSQEFYVQGEKHGWDINFSENGDTTYKAQYVYDLLHGPVYYYSDIGQLQLVRYYDYGVLIGYSYPGQEGKLVKMIPVENGTGNVVAYYPDGKKARSFQYAGGEFNGAYTIYHSNGNISDVSNYRSGVLYGERIDYYPDQTVKSKCYYVNDELHGPYVSYHENGQLSEEMTYINGGLSGYARFYDENGDATKVLYYFNNQVIHAEYY